MRSLPALLFVLMSLTSPAWADYTQIAINTDRFCGLSETGRATCTSGSEPTVSTLMPPDETFTEIGLGYRHACGITEAGDVLCWGDETHEDQIYPPGFDAPVVKLSVGPYHSCAIDSGGTTKCWGQNVHGQTDVPGDADDLVDVTAFGIYSSCGMKSDSEMTCWGSFFNTLIPYAAQTDSPFLQLESSYDISCGIHDDGTADCWSAHVGNLLVARFENGPYRKVVPMHNNSTHAACALTFSGELDCASHLYNGGYRQSTPLSITRATQTYRDVHADGDRLFGYTTEGRLEQLTGYQNRQNLLDTVNGELDMPTPTLTAAWFYGDSIGTELFFEVDQDAYTYRHQFDTQVFRDGELIDTTDSLGSWIDRSATSDQTHTYTLRAVHAFGQVGDYSNALSTGEQPDSPSNPGGHVPSDERSASPSGLRAEVYWYDVELFWDRQSAGSVSLYEIRRNGEFAGTTNGTSWYDDSNADGDLLQYDVIAIGADGEILGLDSVRVQVGEPVCR